ANGAAIQHPTPGIPADGDANSQHQTSNSPTKPALRFILHESNDAEADRMRLDGLIDLLRAHPGDDGVRIFIHAHDGDKIELTLPNARASVELRDLGIEMLGPNGDAEPLASQIRTRGVEPLEV